MNNNNNEKKTDFHADVVIFEFAIINSLYKNLYETKKKRQL